MSYFYPSCSRYQPPEKQWLQAEHGKYHGTRSFQSQSTPQPYTPLYKERMRNNYTLHTPSGQPDGVAQHYTSPFSGIVTFKEFHPPLCAVMPEKRPPCLYALVTRQCALHMCSCVACSQTLNGCHGVIYSDAVSPYMRPISCNLFDTLYEISGDQCWIVVAAGDLQPDNLP